MVTINLFGQQFAGALSEIAQSFELELEVDGFIKCIGTGLFALNHQTENPAVFGVFKTGIHQKSG